jgi:hypothetical protein
MANRTTNNYGAYSEHHIIKISDDNSILYQQAVSIAGKFDIDIAQEKLTLNEIDNRDDIVVYKVTNKYSGLRELIYSKRFETISLSYGKTNVSLTKMSEDECNPYKLTMDDF